MSQDKNNLRDEMAEKCTQELVGPIIIQEDKRDFSLHKAGFVKGWDAHEANFEEKKSAILKVCDGHTDLMWSAKIISILLNCDFRDAKEEITKWKTSRV